jgi:hypothetical protein
MFGHEEAERWLGRRGRSEMSIDLGRRDRKIVDEIEYEEWTGIAIVAARAEYDSESYESVTVVSV